MKIQSSIEEVIEIMNQLLEDVNQLQLLPVERVNVTGIPAQEVCEQLYSDMRVAIEDYNERVQVDAKHIYEIGWGFEELDATIRNEWNHEG